MSAGIISTGSFPKALRPGVKTWWGEAYAEYPEEYKMLFDMEMSDKSYEELVEATGFGLAPAKPETTATVFDNAQQGTVTRSTHVAYGLGYIVSKEEIEDNLYIQVSKSRTRSLAFSMRQTKENVGANVYNNAYDPAYPLGDGQPLITTNHPTLSGTQSNQLAVPADLSEASLEDLTIQIMKARNSRNLRIQLKPTALIVPPDLSYEACRILKSILQNDTANNAVNALYNINTIPEGYKVNHYLNDTTAYFIRTNVPRGSGLVYFERAKDEFDMDNDFTTSNAQFKAYGRYSFTAGDFRAIYGSEGT